MVSQFEKFPYCHNKQWAITLNVSYQTIENIRHERNRTTKGLLGITFYRDLFNYEANLNPQEIFFGSAQQADASLMSEPNQIKSL